jgi:hypothetical protein
MDSHHEPPIHIIIDKKEYTAPQPVMTGSELRALAKPPIGPDRDLFLVVPGKDDEKIGNSQPVPLKSGMHFYSAPAHINPGARRGVA